MRLKAFIPAVVVALSIGFLPAPASAAPRDQWLQAGHDAGHTYANLGENQLTVAALKAMPAFPGFARSTVDVGLIDVSDPLVDGDSMYVTSRAWDGESGRLERFDVPSEERLWTRDLSCFGPPVVSSGWILIEDKCTESAPAPAQMISPDDAMVHDFAADQLGIVDRGVGYFTNYGGGVYQDPWLITAQDLATEKILWQKTSASAGDVTLPVLASGGTLYVEHNQAIGAWDVATGDLRWSRTPVQNVTPLAATAGALYVRWQDGALHGIARWGASDGATDWRIRTPATDTTFAFTPQTLYETGPDFLAARSATNGRILWERSGFFWSDLGQPVYAAGVVWAFQQAGGLEAYNARNGNEVAYVSTAPPGPITVAKGHVFIASPDGRVFIYQLPS